jgi:hypothetical protein
VPQKSNFYTPTPPAREAGPLQGLSPPDTLDTQIDSGFDEDVSSFDADRPPSIEELKARRRPVTPEDRRVSDAALSWMASLPRDRRLMYTMLDYPHVVNSMAQRWFDRGALGQYFDSLLHTRRRRRAGFSAPTQAELAALADWARSEGLLD